MRGGKIFTDLGNGRQGDRLFPELRVQYLGRGRSLMIQMCSSPIYQTSNKKHKQRSPSFIQNYIHTYPLFSQNDFVRVVEPVSSQNSDSRQGREGTQSFPTTTTIPDLSPFTQEWKQTGFVCPTEWWSFGHYTIKYLSYLSITVRWYWLGQPLWEKKFEKNSKKRKLTSRSLA